MRVLGIGEILWDIFPAQELLGGAALNFSANLARLGDSAALITGVGKDARGQSAIAAMQSLGVITDFVEVVQGSSTGVALVGTDDSGEPHFSIPRPAAFDRVDFSPAKLAAAIEFHPDWLYCGTLLQTEPRMEAAMAALAAGIPGARCFYDMNLRAGHWNFALVQRICQLATILKLNAEEARTLSECAGRTADAWSLESFCSYWAATYDIDSICVTLGPEGCAVYLKGSFSLVPGYAVQIADTVGAGDAFAAAFLHGYHRGWPVLRTAQFANALGSLVASRAGATPAWTMEECLNVASLKSED